MWLVGECVADVAADARAARHLFLYGLEGKARRQRKVVDPAGNRQYESPRSSNILLGDCLAGTVSYPKARLHCPAVVGGGVLKMTWSKGKDENTVSL